MILVTDEENDEGHEQFQAHEAHIRSSSMVNRVLDFAVMNEPAQEVVGHSCH